MLENRSFDSMFGKLYPKSSGFEGLTGNESNPWHKPDGSVQNCPVWNDSGMGPATAVIPDPDPGELFLQDMNVQLFGLGGVPGDAPPPMSGFVDNYMRQPNAGDHCDPMAVMHYFTPDQVPVISTLAKAFGVSDQWHASAPCQTWPNRFFTHTGTAGGYVDNSPTHFPYSMPTIFSRLESKGRTWKVYFHDVPQAATLAELWSETFTHFHHFQDDFEDDARKGALVNYSFIEPRYFPDRDFRLLPNDEHPPHNVVLGEQLIARVYNAIRSAPTWKQTLLIVTYDEHGGCYDHVPPPLAVSPDARTEEFAFNRYGVRVPAVIISPYMPPRSVVRSAPAGLKHRGPPFPFDHTSILSTLRRLFDLGPALTARDAVAPDLIGILSLNDPENDGPATVTAPEFQASPEAVAKMSNAPLNSMQKSLCSAAALLPASAAMAAAHIQALPPNHLNPAAPSLQTAGDAAAYARVRVKSFLR
jgi:phospholipase C